jgi:8-oxo-dGTP pyrophosphatase MutT (NUDIX family)
MVEVVQGVVAVLQRDGALLVIQRAAGIPLGGAWCFPGGGLLPDESEVEAVIREVREEVGLLVRPTQRLWVWERPDGGLRLHWWGAELEGGVLTANPAEVQTAAWLNPADIRLLPGLLPGNLEFLDRYHPG